MITTVLLIKSEPMKCVKKGNILVHYHCRQDTSINTVNNKVADR